MAVKTKLEENPDRGFSIVIEEDGSGDLNRIMEKLCKKHSEAQERGLSCEQYPANWKTHGKAAGPIRNEQMANVANALIAFWDGQSRGTANMISLAKSKGLKIAVVRY